MLKAPNYPLRFDPIFKERIWGGRRLETQLGKKPPEAGSIGESWEISDHGQDVSVVANGPHRGRALHELLARFPDEMLGADLAKRLAATTGRPPRLPLLVKWLDVCEKLSVQVHPCDGHPRLPPGEPGKTECWLVVEAAPDSEILLGLRRGIDRAALLRELNRGTPDRCLKAIPARPGDFVFVPAGTVHAIGGGVLAAEIQQSSDTTFRLFDWNRVESSTGRARALHVEAALDCIAFDAVPIEPLNTLSLQARSGSTPLLTPDVCVKFAVSLCSVSNSQAVGGSGRFHVLVCIAGSGEIDGGGEVVVMRRGDCVLLPAAGSFLCRTDQQVALLDAWVP